MKNVDILIVGGGPVGLSMALALARHNIPSLLVERHPHRTNHPRARCVSMRTMELLSQWGNIEDLLKYEFPKEAIRFIWAQSLKGDEITRVAIKDTHGPFNASFITQDCVEDYLLNTLKHHPSADVQFWFPRRSQFSMEAGICA